MNNPFQSNVVAGLLQLPSVRVTSFAKLQQQSHGIYHIYGGSLPSPVKAEFSCHPCHTLSWKKNYWNFAISVWGLCSW